MQAIHESYNTNLTCPSEINNNLSSTLFLKSNSFLEKKHGKFSNQLECSTPTSLYSSLTSTSSSFFSEVSHPADLNPDNLVINYEPLLSLILYRVKRKKLMTNENKFDIAKVNEELENFYSNTESHFYLNDLYYTMNNYKNLKKKYFYFLFIKKSTDDLEVFKYPPVFNFLNINTSMLIINLTGENLFYYKKSNTLNSKIRLKKWKKPLDNNDFYFRLQNLCYINIFLTFKRVRFDEFDEEEDDDDLLLHSDDEFIDNSFIEQSYSNSVFTLSLPNQEDKLNLNYPLKEESNITPLQSNLLDNISLSNTDSSLNSIYSDSITTSNSSISSHSSSSLSYKEIEKENNRLKTLDKFYNFLKNNPLKENEIEKILKLLQENKKSSLI